MEGMGAGLVEAARQARAEGRAMAWQMLADSIPSVVQTYQQMGPVGWLALGLFVLAVLDGIRRRWRRLLSGAIIAAVIAAMGLRG